MRPSSKATVATPEITRPTCSTAQSAVPAVGATWMDHFQPGSLGGAADLDPSQAYDLEAPLLEKARLIGLVEALQENVDHAPLSFKSGAGESESWEDRDMLDPVASRAAAIGFSVHTGWAASVVVEGPLGKPRMVDRRRIPLVESDDTLKAEVYHRASEMTGAAAANFVRAAERAATRRAKEELSTLVKGQRLAAAALLTGAAKLPSELAAILRSHPLIHTAEGVFYREALAAAAEGCGLEVVRIPRRELQDRFAAALRTNAKGAGEWLTAAGRHLGPPWARDQKDAAMAAVVALAATHEARR